MDRLLATLAVALVAGCSSSGPTRFAGDAAVLSEVSSDQQWVALLTGTTRLPTGAHVGALQVAPTSGAPPTMLDGNSPGGLFNRGTTLWYLGGVTVVAEGTPPADDLYGGLFVWTPAMAAPAKVGDDVRDFDPSQDGSSCVFVDWAQPSAAATTTGTLVAVSAASCASGSCDKITIATDITAAAAGWRISNDGRFVLATVRGATATDPGRVILVTLASGQAQLLSTGVDARSPMMTPAGDTVAWVEGANEIHVMSTAGGDPTVLMPTAPLADSAVMIDAANFVAKIRTTATDPATLAKVSASGTTPLPVQKPQQYFVSQHVPGKTDHFVFYSLATIAANGEPDLWMLDMNAANAQPVGLAAAVDTPIASAVAFSDDGSTIEYFDNFDPVTRRGDEYVVPLTMPTRTLVGIGMHNAAFIPSTAQLLYVNAPDPNSGAGVLTFLTSPTATPLAQGVGTVNFVDSRQSPERTWFTQITGAPDDGVWYMPQPGP